MDNLNIENEKAVLDYLRRFGLLAEGSVTPSGHEAYATVTYAQPTPIGLLDLAVSGSNQKGDGYSHTGIDALSVGLNKNSDGFGGGVTTDYQGKNPVFELTYGKRF